MPCPPRRPRQLQLQAARHRCGACSDELPMGAPVIELSEVTKVYQTGDVELRALDGVSLRIDEGEFVAVMGSSGSGKSTLMNIVGCLDRPTTGTYVLAGRKASGMSRAELARVRNRSL